MKKRKKYKKRWLKIADELLMALFFSFFFFTYWTWCKKDAQNIFKNIRRDKQLFELVKVLFYLHILAAAATKCNPPFPFSQLRFCFSIAKQVWKAKLLVFYATFLWPLRWKSNYWPVKIFWLYFGHIYIFSKYYSYFIILSV